MQLADGNRTKHTRTHARTHDTHSLAHSLAHTHAHELPCLIPRRASSHLNKARQLEAVGSGKGEIEGKRKRQDRNKIAGKKKTQWEARSRGVEGKKVWNRGECSDRSRATRQAKEATVSIGWGCIGKKRKTKS